MPFLITTIVLCVIIVGVALLAQRMGWIPGRRKLPYAKRGPLLSPAEIAFHAVLEQAVGGRYRIMAKVRMADLIKLAGAEDRKEGTWAINKISGKHLDFVLCDPQTFAIICAVELDDSSHRRADRMDRDDFVNDAMVDAGLPLFRVKASASYRVTDLQQGIANAITPPTPTTSQPNRPVQPVLATSAPTCPACGATMILRTTKKGDRAGDNFWGCPTYPSCRATLPYKG